MLKFEQEITDNFKKIFSIGKTIESKLSNQDSMDEKLALEIAELYKERKPFFDLVSELIEADRVGEGKIDSNLEKWKQNLKPMLEQDQRLSKLLSLRLKDTKDKLRMSNQNKSLLVYSKSDKV